MKDAAASSAERLIQNASATSCSKSPSAGNPIHPCARWRCWAFSHMMPELSAMKGCEQSPPHVYDVWEHTLKVLGHLRSDPCALESGSGGDDPFLNALVSALGKYRERFSSHFTRSLNTDRSVRAALFFAALYHDVEKPATKTVEYTGRIRFFDHDVL
ncbi:MAG: hypothetical protein U0V48_14965 [Anaerolineales bacterium]